MILFLVSFAGWELAGGFNNSWMARFTQMEKSLFFVIAVIALLGLVTSLKVRNHHDPIEIVNLSNEAV
jgi:cell division protein FtsL